MRQRHRGLASRTHYFAEQEQVSQQRAEVDGGIQIVNQLGTDRRLSEHDVDRRQGVLGIAIEDSKEPLIGLKRLDAFSCEGIRTTCRQSP